MVLFYDILDDMKCFVYQSKFCEMYCVMCDKIVCIKCVIDNYCGYEFD